MTQTVLDNIVVVEDCGYMCTIRECGTEGGIIQMSKSEDPGTVGEKLTFSNNMSSKMPTTSAEICQLLKSNTD